jgi:hypothetical protein
MEAGTASTRFSPPADAGRTSAYGTYHDGAAFSSYRLGVGFVGAHPRAEGAARSNWPLPRILGCTERYASQSRQVRRPTHAITLIA